MKKKFKYAKNKALLELMPFLFGFYRKPLIAHQTAMLFVAMYPNEMVLKTMKSRQRFFNLVQREFTVFDWAIVFTRAVIAQLLLL